jgi:hypothetical protein
MHAENTLGKIQYPFMILKILEEMRNRRINPQHDKGYAQ